MSDDTLKQLLHEQRKTNELLTILIGIFADDMDQEDSAPSNYLSGHPRENPKA